MKSIFEFWIEQGVTIYRVDNPHTKALPFWEWCIGELKRRWPELIFLSEAFTRPKPMRHLAKGTVAATYEALTMNVDLEKRKSASYPPDVNCDDVNGPIQVTGPDSVVTSSGGA